jgi:hypothetical protein
MTFLLYGHSPDVENVFTLVSTHLFLTDFQYSTNWKIPNTTQSDRGHARAKMDRSPSSLDSWRRKEELTGLNCTGTGTRGLYSLGSSVRFWEAESE